MLTLCKFGLNFFVFFFFIRFWKQRQINPVSGLYCRKDPVHVQIRKDASTCMGKYILSNSTEVGFRTVKCGINHKVCPYL